jgi:hypothetical protein
VKERVLMKIKYVQDVIEEVIKILENINFQENNKINNQKKVNKAYDVLFELRKELITARKGGTKDE